MNLVNLFAEREKRFRKQLETATEMEKFLLWIRWIAFQQRLQIQRLKQTEEKDVSHD